MGRRREARCPTGRGSTRRRSSSWGRGLGARLPARGPAVLPPRQEVVSLFSCTFPSPTGLTQTRVHGTEGLSIARLQSRCGSCANHTSQPHLPQAPALAPARPLLRNPSTSPSFWRSSHRCHRASALASCSSTSRAGSAQVPGRPLRRIGLPWSKRARTTARTSSCDVRSERRETSQRTPDTRSRAGPSFFRHRARKVPGAVYSKSPVQCRRRVENIEDDQETRSSYLPYQIRVEQLGLSKSQMLRTKTQDDGIHPPDFDTQARWNARRLLFAASPAVHYSSICHA